MDSLVAGVLSVGVTLYFLKRNVPQMLMWILIGYFIGYFIKKISLMHMKNKGKNKVKKVDLKKKFALF